MFIKILLYILLAIVLISITYNAIVFFVNYNKSSSPVSQSTVAPSSSASSEPSSTTGDDSSSSNVPSWPPYVSSCPDYWQDMGNGECKNSYGVGVNDEHLRTCVDNPTHPITEWTKDFRGITNLKKCEWTKKCGRKFGIQAVWQGVDGLC